MGNLTSHDPTVLVKAVRGFCHAGFCSAIYSIYTVWDSLRKKKSKYFSSSSHLKRLSKNWLASFYMHTLYSALFSTMPSGLFFFPSDISKLHNAKQISFNAKARSRRMNRPSYFSRKPDELLLILTTCYWRVKVFLQRLNALQEKKDAIFRYCCTTNRW